MSTIYYVAHEWSTVKSYPWRQKNWNGRFDSGGSLSARTTEVSRVVSNTTIVVAVRDKSPQPKMLEREHPWMFGKIGALRGHL